VLLLVGAGAAAVVLAKEKVEHIGSPETAAVRPPQGEWISSVPGDTARVWAVGDADPPDSARVVRLIRRADPDRILYLGDVYETGGPDDFTRWAKPWHGLLGRMAPVPGNHEWPRAREGYEPFWRKVTGETPPTYYSFRAGGWDILSVNAEHEEWHSVKNWLRDQTSSGGNCRIAFWHRPAYSAGAHPSDERAQDFMDAIQGGARIVVNGHDHNMQRMRSRHGIVEFISGAGGRERYDVDEDYPRLAFSDDQHYGALRLRLSPERAKWRFVTPHKHVLDSGTLRCHA
jgi:Calcineurin-like phosphoesterase